MFHLCQNLLVEVGSRESGVGSRESGIGSRVIKASGELGGYRWGKERKSALLGWEASFDNLP